MIPRKAIEAIHAAICEESLEDHMDPAWPGRCVKAVQAAAPHLMAAAWGEGYGAGWNDCLLELENGGAKMSANPYRKEQA